MSFKLNSNKETRKRKLEQLYFCLDLLEVERIRGRIEGWRRMGASLLLNTSQESS